MSVVLVIQHAKRMRRVILPYVSCPAIPYFPTLSHKLHDFRKKKKSYSTRSAGFWFSLQLLSETFLITRRIERDIVNVRSPSGNVPVIEFNNCPTRCDLFSLLYFCRQLYMFRVLTPIIRSSYTCSYSFWYWLTGSTTIRSRCWEIHVYRTIHMNQFQLNNESGW